MTERRFGEALSTEVRASDQNDDVGVGVLGDSARTVMRKSSIAIICMCSATATFSLLLPEPAGAATVKRQHGSMCHVVRELSSGEALSENFQPYEGKNGVWFFSTENLTLLCAIDEDPDLVRTAITSATVYGRLGDNTQGLENVVVKACRSYTTTDGGECGFEAVATSLGNYALSPNLSTAWSTTTGFAYIVVLTLSGWDTTVRGIALNN